MNCPMCGVEVVEHAAFCHQCGARLEGADDDGATETARADLADAEETSVAGRFRQTAASRESRSDVEQQLWTGTYCPQTMVGSYALAAAVAIASIVIGVMVAHTAVTWILVIGNVMFLAGVYLRYMYQRINVRYLLTTQRFVHEVGVLRRVTDRIEVIDFDDITVEQGPVERLLGIGKIRITSSDRTHPEIRLPGIDNVRHVAALMDDARRDERRRRGLYVESV